MGLRIALTHAHSWPEVRRGGERFLHELASALARRGHDVTILAGASSGSRSLENGVRVVRIARPAAVVGERFREERVFGRRVLPFLVRERFDVVHSMLPSDASASVLSASVRRSRRTVYTCLGIPVRSYWDARPDRRAHDRVLSGIDVYGCLSGFSLGCLRSEYERTGALTPGGVDLATFSPKVDRSPTPVLLFSGALAEPRKGLSVLIDAMVALVREVPEVRVWLSGPGDPSPILDAAPAFVRDRVEVLGVGTIDEQPSRYAAAWATVVPSRDEAFGLVAVESLASGTPIVVSDHGGLPELAEPGTGFVATVGNPDALAQACLAAIEAVRRPDIRDACMEAARRHDWDASVAPAIEALYLGTERDAGAQS